MKSENSIVESKIMKAASEVIRDETDFLQRIGKLGAKWATASTTRIK